MQDKSFKCRLSEKWRLVTCVSEMAQGHVEVLIVPRQWNLCHLCLYSDVNPRHGHYQSLRKFSVLPINYNLQCQC